MDIVRFLFGVVLLTFGRRLFWLFVGVVGFVVGFDLATRMFASSPQWVAIIVGIVIGLIGALLAVVLQRFAVAVAGFLIGGYIANFLLETLGVSLGDLAWLPYIIGGVLGAILAFLMFDWALIILSSLAGATFIVQAFQMDNLVATVLLVVLFVIGIIVQAGLTGRERRIIRRRTQ